MDFCDSKLELLPHVKFWNPLKRSYPRFVVNHERITASSPYLIRKLAFLRDKRRVETYKEIFFLLSVKYRQNFSLSSISLKLIDVSDFGTVIESSTSETSPK